MNEIHYLKWFYVSEGLFIKTRAQKTSEYLLHRGAWFSFSDSLARSLSTSACLSLHLAFLRSSVIQEHHYIIGTVL